MNRDHKASVVAEIQNRFANASVTFVTTNRGLTVEQANALRRTLKAVEGEYKVAKHTLVRRALQGTSYGEIDSFLEGPRSLVFGYADPVRIAKALVDFAEQNQKLEIDGGALDGQIFQAERVKALAKMPSVEVLRARVVRQALFPASRIVSVSSAPARRLAGAIKAFVKKLEDAEAR